MINLNSMLLLTLSIAVANSFQIMIPNTLNLSILRNQKYILATSKRQQSQTQHQFKLASTPSSTTSMYLHDSNHQPPRRDPNPVFPTYNHNHNSLDNTNSINTGIEIEQDIVINSDQESPHVSPHPDDSPNTTIKKNTNTIPKINPASKFFNLEEMEDKEVCTTEVFLSQNGSVTLTETNGPPPVASYGHWKVVGETTTDGDDGDNMTSFVMTVTRTYSSGRDHTSIGEFTFDVERTFIGDLSYVGSLVSVEGSMHMQDEFRGGDVEVGFFSMIDTTAAKLGEEDKY